MEDYELKDEILALLLRTQTPQHYHNAESVSKNFNISEERADKLLEEIANGRHCKREEPFVRRGGEKFVNKYRVNVDTKRFLENGGYTSLHYKAKELEDLQTSKLRIDVKNANRIFKTYWWTFGFSLLGLAISIYLVILKIIESKAR